MSEKIKDKSQNEVSPININKEEFKEEDVSIYKEFCQQNQGQDFNSLKMEQLKQIYNDGKSLLNQYYIVNKNVDNMIISQIQYIVSSLEYCMSIKKLNEISTKNTNLNRNLQDMVKKAKIIEKDLKSKKEDIDDMKKDLKSVVTTIISIILAISIIPTAITGIERIDSSYILPFLSSIILFGMIMIIFVYSIYQDKIKTSTWLFLGIVLSFTIIFWYNACYKNIQNNKKENSLFNVKQQIANHY